MHAIILGKTATVISALTLGAGLSAFATDQAEANNWGCQVLLCLSNPAGPMAVSECVLPITKLYKSLEKGHKFPKCDARGTHFSYIDRGHKPYEDCTDGRVLAIRGNSGNAICHKQVTTLEYFGRSTVGAANLDPGDTFVYRIRGDGDYQEIVGVNDAEPAIPRPHPNFLTYSAPTTGTHTVWF